MKKLDFCQYADVFYGNGETDRFFEDGLASKWFYVKALCGNTTPHATLPFGKMSVGAYSGGYPAGYGMHYPNSAGGIRKLGERHTVRGFSHLHQSGTGAIRYYYNYAVTTPHYEGERGGAWALANEEGRPGYYKARLRDILCELTVEGGVALHRYTFGKEGGRISVDFSNDGLSRLFGEDYFSAVQAPRMEILSEDEVIFSGVFSGVPLYFCVKARAAGDAAPWAEGDAYGATFRVRGREALVRVGYSTVSAHFAREEVARACLSFDEAARRAYEIWNGHLSRIKIETEDASLRRKFYSCLYHSLVKPCDLSGETVQGVAGDTVSDFATFWDQYKTALPLIYFCYPEMGEKIARGIVNISRTLGRISCSFGLSTILPCEEQAKMLGILSLCDAHHMGYGCASAEVIEECTERELRRSDFASFLEEGTFERYTHVLDTTDACLSVAQIVEDGAFRRRLLALGENWRRAYDGDGLMSEKSPYYEGDRYTYSFRVQKNMEERVALAGGKERFCEMLDAFFGFGGESVKQLTYLGAGKEIAESAHHRFEGFNNECDMETPYAYIYAGRHDRLCEILRECVHRSFGEGTSGLPGNNDSGGLSSLFVWNALGIFPISGSGEFLIGAPAVEEAKLTLAQGTLEIRVHRENGAQYRVKRVTWNGEEVSHFKLPMAKVAQGGVLEFTME